MKNPPTLVIFRVSRSEPRDVFALFPLDPATADGWCCTCYQHIGQHSAADPMIARNRSRPATRAEAAPLARELRRIGYRLRIGRRVPRNAFSVRKQEIQNVK
jgi:hypothetical protein